MLVPIAPSSQELQILAAMMRAIADEHRPAAPLLSELAEIYDYRAWRAEGRRDQTGF